MQRPDQIQVKLAAARTRLILEQPFIGALVMHLSLAPARGTWCETTATDARALYFNPDYVAGLDLRETQFILAHEALHCALGHFARRAHRVKRRWDLACDYAVNMLLADEGMKPPAGALLNPAWRGLSAEEIYSLIPSDSDHRTLDLHLFDGEGGGRAGPGAGTSRPAPDRDQAARPGSVAVPGELAAESAAVAAGGGPESASEAGRPGLPWRHGAGDLIVLWKTRMAGAAQQAARAGRMSDSWMRAVDRLIQPQLPWRQLLARFLSSVAREDYSFQRPSRREGEAILPRLAGAQAEIVVVLDTSGSIGAEELAEFAAELDALKGQVRARITLHACDHDLDPRGPWIFESWEALELPLDLRGGGGTRFTPVFARVAGEHLRPDLLVYFTDGEGEFPAEAPHYPVIWLVKGRAPVPWGERVQLN